MTKKNDLYDVYVDTHIKYRYGSISLARISTHFKMWSYYFKKFLPRKKDATILDMGCGDGGFVYWLMSLGYTNCKGIDISAQQIDLGKSLGIKNINCEDLYEHLKTHKSQYDLIVARDILEHFDKKDVAVILELIYNSLRPGGVLFLQVPNGEGIFYTEIFYSDFTHETAFTKSSLHQVLSKCSYESIKTFPVNPPLISIPSIIRNISWHLLVSLVKTLRFIERGRRDALYTQNIICFATKSSIE